MNAPTYQSGQRIQSGDWVRVYASRYGVWHHGIVLRLAPHPHGTAVEIIHSTKGGGVAVADWYDFAEGNPVLLHRRPESNQHAEQVVARAAANLGKSYALFAQNCEHFASFSFYGEAASETVAALGWMAASVVTVAVLMSDKR